MSHFKKSCLQLCPILHVLDVFLLRHTCFNLKIPLVQMSRSLFSDVPIVSTRDVGGDAGKMQQVSHKTRHSCLSANFKLTVIYDVRQSCIICFNSVQFSLFIQHCFTTKVISWCYRETVNRESLNPITYSSLLSNLFQFSTG